MSRTWGFWTLDPARDGLRLELRAEVAAGNHPPLAIARLQLRELDRQAAAEHGRAASVPGGTRAAVGAVLLGAALLGSGCAVNEVPTSLQVGFAAPAVETDSHVLAGIRYAVTLEPSIAADAVAAIDLFRDATGGFYDPTLTIGECDGSERICIRALEMMPDCAGERDPWGCMLPTGEITIWAGMHSELRVSIVAHEIGHSLGLSHADGSVMFPERSWRELYWTCLGSEMLIELQALLGVPEVEPLCLRAPE